MFNTYLVSCLLCGVVPSLLRYYSLRRPYQDFVSSTLIQQQYLCQWLTCSTRNLTITGLRINIKKILVHRRSKFQKPKFTNIEEGDRVTPLVSIRVSRKMKNVHKIVSTSRHLKKIDLVLRQEILIKTEPRCNELIPKSCITQVRAPHQQNPVSKYLANNEFSVFSTVQKQFFCDISQ